MGEGVGGPCLDTVAGFIQKQGTQELSPCVLLEKVYLVSSTVYRPEDGG